MSISCQSFSSILSPICPTSAFLIFRPHPYTYYDRKKLRKILKKHRNVSFSDMKIHPDTMLLLAVSDLLITDWSSIYTDFLVTRRPIIFMEHRTDLFTNSRGKSLVPPEMRPGIIAKGEEDFFNALAAVLKGKYKIDEDFYDDCLRTIHGNTDGKAAERVIEVIDALIKK